jgi:hypothetical protein
MLCTQPILVLSPALAVAVRTLTGTLGLMLWFLGAACFWIDGRRTAPDAGVAFGTVAVAIPVSLPSAFWLACDRCRQGQRRCRSCSA